MELLCEFDFEIKHVRVKENKVVDALRNKFHLVPINVCKEDLKSSILEASSSDKFYLQAKRELQKE